MLLGSKLRCLVASPSPYTLYRSPMSSVLSSRKSTVSATSFTGYIPFTLDEILSLPSARQGCGWGAAVFLDLFLDLLGYLRIKRFRGDGTMHVDHTADDTVNPLRDGKTEHGVRRLLRAIEIAGPDAGDREVGSGTRLVAERLFPPSGILVCADSFYRVRFRPGIRRSVGVLLWNRCTGVGGIV